MMANGPVKALLSTKWQTFLDQMGLSDEIIHRSEELAKTRLKSSRASWKNYIPEANVHRTKKSSLLLLAINLLKRV
jgi:hypothetical protein